MAGGATERTRRPVTVVSHGKLIPSPRNGAGLLTDHREGKTVNMTCAKVDVAALPMTDTAIALMREAAEKGHAEEDISTIVLPLADRS